MNKKLYRDEYHKMIGGVCAGMAEYFEMDVTVIRLLFAFSVIIMGVGFIPYIVLWIVLPKKGYLYNNFNNPSVDYTVPPQQPEGQFNTPPPQADRFGGTPFGSSQYANNPFSAGTTQNVMPKQKSNAGIIVGVVLIIVGAAVLIDQLDIIPDFDFTQLWPAVLIIVGGMLIITGQKKKPFEMPASPQTEHNEETPTEGQSI